jgi:hypothetical protein
MLTHFARWFLRKSPGQRTVWRTVAVALGTYGAALLSAIVATTLDKVSAPAQFVLASVATFGLVTLMVLMAYLLGQAIAGVQAAEAREHAEEKKQEEVLAAARVLADASTLSEIDRLTRAGRSGPEPADETAPLQTIQGLVEATYRTLDAHYGQAARLAETIEFEVTFMTRSYKDDGITIPAASNEHGRSPKSMLERPGNPHKYDETVTGDVYSDHRHEPQFVEDTRDEEWSGRYNLYPEQRLAILSALVWPVLAADYTMLGTLVMHCDRARFFLKKDRKFWGQFCEIFSKRIALAKLQLDMRYLKWKAEDGGWELPPEAAEAAPF